MILFRYTFREMISSTLLATLLSTFVIFLQKSGQVFELLIRSSAKPKVAAYIFALTLPQLLPLTIPFGVLVGILIGLGRMSADGEITAMRAAGVPSQKVIAPVLSFALLATLVAGAASTWGTPAALRETYRVLNRIATEQVTADIQPQVFAEQFPNKIVYVEDVRTGPVVEWRNLFIADITPPEDRKADQRDRSDLPMITVARQAIAVPDARNSRIQLSLSQAITHEVDKDGKAHDTDYERGEQTLPVSPPDEQHAKDFAEMPTRQLPWYTKHSPKWLDARIELHKRLALPLGCLALTLVGIPLGVSSRKGGKSGGYVTAIFLAFFCYYLTFISLIGLAKSGKLPVEVAAWTPNALFTVFGIIFLLRLEIPGDRDLMGAIRSWIVGFSQTVGSRLPGAPQMARSSRRFPWLPQIVDTYILTQFVFYFALTLASFVFMTEIFTFFDLLPDIVKNNIAMSEVVEYLFFLTPHLIYDLLPESVLVAVLVTFGVLSKHNEITAFKASGVSLYRLSAPVLLASVVLSAGLFAFDYYYVPQANRRQDALRDHIKGRAVQTYLRPDRKWIKGAGSRIYYYRYFDTVEDVMNGVSVYELDPATFRLKTEISAERAQWQPSQHKWIFQNGWRRDVMGSARENFTQFQATAFPELDEPPSYFLKEVKLDKQMNFHELDAYIEDLKQSGFDTVHLRVQLHKKFSVPLFALIMAMISAPFAFLVGNRGAMAGIGTSIGVAIAYLAIQQLFEQIGNVNHLPPAIAAWSPDAVFALVGMYLLLKMRS
jgi:LPS export ABC transporter permease LptG/LPS export ABC transporter permease LptF